MLKFLDRARLHSQTHTHSHSHTLLWRSDQLVAEAATYTTRKKTQQTKSRALRGIRTRTLSSRAAAELRLGQPFHRQRPVLLY